MSLFFKQSCMFQIWWTCFLEDDKLLICFAQHVAVCIPVILFHSGITWYLYFKMLVHLHLYIQWCRIYGVISDDFRSRLFFYHMLVHDLYAPKNRGRIKACDKVSSVRQKKFSINLFFKLLILVAVVWNPYKSHTRHVKCSLQ